MTLLPNTPEVRTELYEVFNPHPDGHAEGVPTFNAVQSTDDLETGRTLFLGWSVVCSLCGAVWEVSKAGPSSKPEFTEVSFGDGSCWGK